MYRKYEERIQNWIDNSKKALLIYGARQVGKTYLIRKMLKKNGISYFEKPKSKDLIIDFDILVKAVDEINNN